MKLRKILEGVSLTGGSADLDMEINSISKDTRTLAPGALFAALSGDSRGNASRLPRERLMVG